MASFLEFLKSGKTAKEFIDTAVLPQHVRPVTRVETSPAPYIEEETGADTDSEIPDVEPKDLSEAEIKSLDLAAPAALLESEEEPDEDFMMRLEALEKEAEAGGGSDAW